MSDKLTPIPMKALVGFSDKALGTPHAPAGAVAAGSPFTAPDEQAAKRLEAEGLAKRAKPDTSAKS